MREREEITISTKHLRLRIVLFAVALLVAVAAFVIGVRSIGRRDPGYSRIEATDKDLLRWNGAVDFEYRFEGSSASIRAQSRALQGVYAEALGWAEKLLDAEERYPGYANLATLNQCMGEDVTVSSELFDVLTDALARTQAGEGYSLFAGPLYAEWNGLLLLEDPEDFDPSADPEEAERLRRLAEAVNDPDNFRFQIVDAQQHVVRFGVSEDLLRLLEELELSCPVLDLNLLHDAYLLQLVAMRVEARGYDSGYLTTPHGLTLALSGESDAELRLFGLQGTDAVPAAKTPLEGGRSYGALRAFALPGETYWYYTVESEGETLYRHPWLCTDAKTPQTVRSVCVSADSAPEAVCQALRLMRCESAEEAQAAAAALALPAAYTLNGARSVYLNAAAGTSYEPEDYGWTLQPMD